MRTSVEPAEGNKVKLSIEVDESEFEPAVDAAFRKIAQEVRIPGFRPGKAPRRLLESRLGVGAGRAQALNDALPEYYADAVRDAEVDVIAPPEIEITAGHLEGPVVFEAVVEVRPVIEIEGHRSISVEIPSAAAVDAEVDEQLERIRMQFSTLETVERAAAEGDFVVMDIEGSQDGEVLEGLVASAYSYEVGSGGIVPELDEQLIGVAAGESRSFDAVHPNSANQAGNGSANEEDGDSTGDDGDAEGESPLHFELTVSEVQQRVLPELNDELAKEASGFETMEEWRTDMVARLSQVKKAQAQMLVREKIGEALAELVTEELPEPLVAGEMQERLQDMAMRLQAQGLSLEQWLQFSGVEPDAFIADLRATAERAAKVDLALRAVAVAERIEASEEDLESEFALVASRVGESTETVREQLTSAGHLPALRVDIAKRKALELLTEVVTITDEQGTAIIFSDLALDEDSDEDPGAGSDATTTTEESEGE